MEDKQYKEYENLVREAELRAGEEKVRNMQMESYLGRDDKSTIREQLDLGEELERIDYLLRGYVIKRDEETRESYWAKSENPDMVVLSDYGVQLVLDVVSWYLNKNTLLSNYDEDTINHKMEDFANDLNDDIFMSYEKVFRYPTLDECKDEIKNKIKHKVDLRLFANELSGTKADKKEIENKIISEMENRIEHELEVIKQQKMKDKLKKFAMIMRKVQDAVHSTYLRAWKGQERTTLRQHIHISETKGFTPTIEQRGVLDKLRGR